MRTDDLDYALPEELIAQEPPPERDAGRMLVLDPGRPPVSSLVRELGRWLVGPTLIIVNDARVIPARLFGEKHTGGRVELLLVERLGPEGPDERWTAMARSSKPLREGAPIALADGRLQASLLAGHPETALVTVAVRCPDGQGSVTARLEQVGQVPLPPYIRREPTEADRERYQTVFARVSGAVAAPTAGLHLTDSGLSALREAGHEVATVTLHVGPGTFAPIRAGSLADHDMHAERYEVPEATADAVDRARAGGRPVLAVGTTVVRTLESAALEGGRLRAGEGETSLFIYPPYRFQVVDMLLTNFHLPRSSLLALVMAFGGIEPVRRAYATAVAERYRFFSYGDAMLLRGREDAS